MTNIALKDYERTRDSLLPPARIDGWRNLNMPKSGGGHDS